MCDAGRAKSTVCHSQSKFKQEFRNSLMAILPNGAVCGVVQQNCGVWTQWKQRFYSDAICLCFKLAVLVLWRLSFFCSVMSSAKDGHQVIPVCVTWAALLKSCWCIFMKLRKRVRHVTGNNKIDFEWSMSRFLEQKIRKFLTFRHAFICIQ